MYCSTLCSCHCNVLARVATALQLGSPFQHSHPPLQRKSVSYSNALLSHCNASRSPLLALPSPIATQVGLLLRHSCNATRSPAPTLSRPIATQVGLPLRHSCNATQSPAPMLSCCDTLAMPLGLLLQRSPAPLQRKSVSPSSIPIPHCNATRSPAPMLSRCHAPNRFGTVNMEDNVNIK